MRTAQQLTVVIVAGGLQGLNCLVRICARSVGQTQQWPTELTGRC